MARRYRLCHWWRAGHRWSRWEPSQYNVHQYGRTIQATKNERTCEKCGEVRVKGLS